MFLAAICCKVALFYIYAMHVISYILLGMLVLVFRFAYVSFTEFLMIVVFLIRYVYCFMSTQFYINMNIVM